MGCLRSVLRGWRDLCTAAVAHIALSSRAAALFLDRCRKGTVGNWRDGSSACSRISWAACELGLKAKGEMTMRVLLVLAAIGFSATAFAQSAPPKVGNKPLTQVKLKEPMGCKLVGTVKGTKLWAGDCVASSELRGAAPATETNLPDAAAGAIPPGP